MESLRDEQKRIARDRILEALAAEVAENGLLDLSMAAVAERSGVSQRTIYNYFETKEALVGSLEDWSEEWMERHGGPLVLHDLDKIPEALVTNYQLFDDMGDIATAIARIRSDAPDDTTTRERFGTGHVKRTEAVRSSLAEVRPDLAEEDLDALAAIFRGVTGFDMWNVLSKEYGLSGAAAGRVAGWAFSAMLHAVRNGEGPYRGAALPST
ncbi:MAG: TetR/AcrR family transcriptional regulator [Acidimicrobiia bacterium]